KLDPLPTQLYISVDAPNKDIYKSLCRPLISDGWERLQKSLELLPSLDTRTVIRHTLVKEHNMEKKQALALAKLDKIADPDMIEPKAYMFIGYSRQRMNLANMPSHSEVREVSSVLQEELGYDLADEKEDSRVTLLAKDKKKIKIPGL
ncbi:MAG: 4-demethylwyosine synthase TYW1, partial [Planctomycetota bacterium]